jgi:hypothetical protein
MFKQVNVDVLGIVENMAGLAIEGRVEGAGAGTQVVLDTGARAETLTTDARGAFGTVVHLFGQGGGERLAARHGFPVLGQVPLNPSVRVGGDAGDPVVVTAPGSLVAARFAEIAGKVAARLSVRALKALPVLQ